MIPVEVTVGVVFVAALVAESEPGLGRIGKELRRGREALGEPLSGWLGAEGLLTVEVIAMDQAFGGPERALLGALASAEARRRWDAATWAVVLRAQAPAQLPLALLAALHGARTLGELREAAIFDEALGAVFVAAELPAVQGGPIVLARHVRVDHEGDVSRTKGLGKWGLPELFTEGRAGAQAEALLLAAARGLFERVVAQPLDREAEALDLSGGMVIDRALLERALGAPGPEEVLGTVVFEEDDEGWWVRAS